MNPGTIAVVGAVALLACSSKSENQSGAETGEPTESVVPADQVEVLNSLADSVTLTHFQNFETKSEEMSDLATSFCTSLSAATLEEVRNAWWAARTPWKHAEIVQFGPITEYPERIGPKLDDWPVNGRAVEDRIASDDVLTLEAFRDYGTATRGLPVAEYLLWSAGDETLALYELEPRRCEMLQAVVQDIHASAVYLIEQWSEDWYNQLRGQPEGEFPVFKEPKDVVDQWVNRMIFTTENIRETKLGKPAGDKTEGNPQPDLLESRLSGRSLQDAVDVLEGIAYIWSGDVDGDQLGIRDLVRDDPRLVERVDALMAETITRLDEVPETLEDTIWDQPEIVGRAQEALVELQKVLQIEVATHIGITVRFNDNDGD